MSDPVVLVPRLDLPAASALKTILADNNADDIELDFSEVKFLGALCLQVLLAAATTAVSHGRNIKLSNVSERVTDQLRLMGMTPDVIARGGQ